ncbi:hypothetical protein D3C79_863680 [compost metagenome]
MAQACDQGQWHGVGDFGADQAAGNQVGVEQEQRHGTQGASADGGQRNHDAEHHTGDYGQQVEAGAAQVIAVAGMFAGECLEFAFEQDGQGSEDQNDGQALLDDGVGGLGVGVQAGEEPQGQGCGRDAAEGQPAGDFPVDVFVLAVDPDAAGFGNGGVQQVSAHCGGRADAEPEQDRGHQ